VLAGRVPKIQATALNLQGQRNTFMNQIPKTLIAAAALGGALSLGVGIGQAGADQPRMHAALDALRAARSNLVDANNDKGGHRAKAIRYVNIAIDEVQAGIRYDRRN
jgi:hypothetical protein